MSVALIRPAAKTDADAALTAALGRLETTKTRCSEAETSLKLAQRARGALVARAAAGEKIAAPESRDADETIRNCEAGASLLRDALPGARAAVEEAEAAVIFELAGEAQQLHQVAATRRQAADARVQAEQVKARAAAELEDECGRVVSMAGNQALAREAAGRIDILRRAIVEVSSKVGR